MGVLGSRDQRTEEHRTLLPGHRNQRKQWLCTSSRVSPEEEWKEFILWIRVITGLIARVIGGRESVWRRYLVGWRSWCKASQGMTLPVCTSE